MLTIFILQKQEREKAVRGIFHYMKTYWRAIFVVIAVKLLAALGELAIPYILEHMIDRVVPQGQFLPVVLWGLAMIGVALIARQSNIYANSTSVAISRKCTEEMRRDLFERSVNLSGSQVDAVTLPSLISRMTSDSYNVQNFIAQIQTIGIRAPIMLLGGIAITMTMDAALASILCIMAPILICVVVFVSRKGIPLYSKVQQRLDTLVRIMRENITGIRVVKALSKEDYEKRRFREANEGMTRDDLTAGIVMAIPGPFVTLCLNIGLVLVVVIGAHRVNAGATEPGVILAFLTYFHMILQSVMAINRIFMQTSKASASSKRIMEVLEMQDDQPALELTDDLHSDSGAFLEFDHVSFTHAAAADGAGADSFAGGERAKCLDDISFRLQRGQTLGLIGATGSGKTTIINLLMRFYDANEGGVYVDGRDVRTYDKGELRSKFGVVFQNDVIFAESLADNIALSRPITREDIERAAEHAMAAPFISEKPDTYDYMADIKGANLSGGQKQRLLIARALAAKPEILVLDDAASALDYRTDASLRRNLREHYDGTTTIIVAQRISSLLHSDLILVLDEGKIVGSGTHEELLKSCDIYLDIYHSQMGDLA